MTDEREISRRGIMLVLSSPSGAGKTTLTRYLLDQENIEDPGKLELSISATTRPRRASEIDGVHYHFVGKRRFETMRDPANFSNGPKCTAIIYGTPREPVERRAGGRPRCIVRHRLAGYATTSRQDARRRRHRVCVAAVGRRTQGAARTPRRGFERDHFAAVEECGRGNFALARIRLHLGQSRSRQKLRAGARNPQPPRG